MDNQAKLTPTGTEILKRKAGRPPNHGNGHDLANRLATKLVEIDTNVAGLSESPIEVTKPVLQELLAPPQTIIEPPPKPLKIAMIGTAPSSRMLAPFNDASWTIWACSPGNMGQMPRVDAWFEVHSNLLWPECISYGQPYVEWLKQQSFPIYMQDKSLVPNAIPLPIQELTQEFGKYFFTSSFAYMIAMAIKAGAQEIALFGIDMASKNEYILQRPGGHFFMQEAAKRGIKVSIPYESDLAQPPALYGYSDSTPFGRKMAVREKELQDRINGMKAERDKLTHSITYLEGALEDMDYVKGIWGGVQT